jgi:hypothetical protein
MDSAGPTATDLLGIVHSIGDDGWSLCGQNAASWSREVTVAQQSGLVIFCLPCQAEIEEASHG